MPQVTVLLIGSTGGGKSTICNVLAGSADLFPEGDGSVSVTKQHQVANVEVDDTLSLRVVDTVGIGDTSLTEEEVLYRIASACYDIRDGLNRVFFVTNSRLTRTEIEVYNIIRTVIFNEGITRFVSIIRTNYSQFMNPQACQADIDRLKVENEAMREILASCSDSMIHVNNPNELAHPNWQTMRGFSRQKLFAHLRNCTEVYRPPELAVINNRIRGHIEESTRLERQNEELMQTIARQQQETKEIRDRLQQSEQNFQSTIQSFQNTQLEMAQQHRADVEEMGKIRREMEAAHAREKAEILASIERARQEAERNRQREAELQAQLAREREQAAAKMREVMEQQAKAFAVQPQGRGGGGGGFIPGFLTSLFRNPIGTVAKSCSVM